MLFRVNILIYNEVIFMYVINFWIPAFAGMTYKKRSLTGMTYKKQGNKRESTLYFLLKRRRCIRTATFFWIPHRVRNDEKNAKHFSREAGRAFARPASCSYHVLPSFPYLPAGRPTYAGIDLTEIQSITTSTISPVDNSLSSY